MSRFLPPLTLTGARVLRDGALADMQLTVADGLIASAGGQEIDLSGYWILPGIVDLHGDAFEHHLAPRPTAPFGKRRALGGVDRETAANGVTTAYLAQSWSWEGGVRSEDYAEDLMAALADVRPRLLTDLRIQIRYETHMSHTDERLLAAIRRFGVDYVVFNNHLPEAREMWDKTPERVASWAGKSGRSPEEHMAIVWQMAAQESDVADSLTFLAEAFDELGVAYGSHDDRDEAARVGYHAMGARICEFPTSLEAASAAQSLDDPVLMGAPNIVRGGSQSGNIAAIKLARRGLCDALVSDYYYPALAQAVWALADDGACSFEDGWAMISSRPAEIIDLTDRGVLSPGKRADLVVMNPETREIEATIAHGRMAYISGEAARRFMAAPDSLRIAAE